MPDASAPSDRRQWVTAPRSHRPNGSVSRLARVLARRVRYGHCVIILPSGEHLQVAAAEPNEPAGPPATLRILRPRALRRLVFGGSIGFAEAYMDGDWSSPDLAALLAFAGRNEPSLGGMARGLWPIRQVHRLSHRLRGNTRAGSQRNIAQHYDLGNDFYALWLDAGMTYSSGLFTTPDQSLDDAQHAKYARLAASLDLRPGQHLLEIGCGWGGFALIAAQEYGCRVTALTLSERQAAYARARVRVAGLAERIDIRIEDYRDVRGRFDCIASIEMFEAVGERYWPDFFAVLRDRLSPGGRAAMQVITIADDRFAAYRSNADFIQRYIFPGGMLPSPSALAREIARAGLQLSEAFSFGRSYVQTLDLWQQRFQRAWPQIAALGYDTRFRRMWEYYLAYCRAGFAVGTIDVCQVCIDQAS